MAKITASGGWLAIHVVVWACCSLTDADVERNSPNNCFKVLIAWFIFCCSNKVIALKKMFGQMIQKPTPEGGVQYITEFKKLKSAKKNMQTNYKLVISLHVFFRAFKLFELRDILDSTFGGRLLYHLAKHFFQGDHLV